MGDGIFRACDRHSDETVALSKTVAKYEHMRKWMVEFLKKFTSRNINILRINSIHIVKSTNVL